MSKIAKLMCLWAALGCGAAWAQSDGFIEGTVTGEAGESLPGANIAVRPPAEDHKAGITADADGQDHVKNLPAVDIAKRGLANANVVVRGFNNIFSGSLLTLTDNRIARVPSLRVNALNFIPLTNDDVERIEVVLGPGSALYGPNSADGVLHIITHSPFTSQGTNMHVGMGERDLRHTTIRHAGVVGDRLGYKISGQYYTGTEWEYTDPEEVKAQALRQAEIDADADLPLLKTRDPNNKDQSVEARLDWRAADDLTAILSSGHNKANVIGCPGGGPPRLRTGGAAFLTP